MTFYKYYCTLKFEMLWSMVNYGKMRRLCLSFMLSIIGPSHVHFMRKREFIIKKQRISLLSSYFFRPMKLPMKF